MSSGFPPIPVYPNDYDSDFTLYLVYNTSETLTVADVDAWAEEIPIRPRHADQTEIWADNGFATIAGELFYYDAVEKNGDDRVCRFKRCVRNLGGSETQFNQSGTWVRGFVIAEHHTQLANCVLMMENFIGENFSPLPATLDWRIRNLEQGPIVSDDYCPEVEFDFNIVSISQTTGTIARYNVSINGGGSMVLQFGDGSSTSVVGPGTHVYAPGANIDPVVVVNTALCQIIQSPINRSNPNTPTPVVISPPFQVPVPQPPVIPPIVIPSIVVPPPTVNIPPVVFPCINPGGFPSVLIVQPPINIPSVVDITPLNIPSVIRIEPPLNIPSRILGPDIQVPSHITSDIPPNITISPPPPIPPIQVQPPQIPPIQMEPAQITSDIPSIIEIQSPGLPSVIMIEGVSDIANSLNSLNSVIMNLANLSNLVNFGDVPSTVNLNVSALSIMADSMSISVLGFPSFIPLHIEGGGLSLIHNIPNKLIFEPLPKLQFDTESLNEVMSVFSENLTKALKFSLPNFSDIKFPDLKVDWGHTPTVKAILKLQKATKRKQGRGMMEGLAEEYLTYEELDFPGEFKLVAPDIPPIKLKHDLPTHIGITAPNWKDIRIDASSVPTEIRLLPPKEDIRISVVPFDMPKMQFDTEALERMAIPLKMPEEMPTIQVVFPDVMPGIKVEFPKEIPTIKVEVPDNTRIPLIYEGPPIPVAPVQINLKIQELAGEASEGNQCVMIVPCKPKK